MLTSKFVKSAIFCLAAAWSVLAEASDRATVAWLRDGNIEMRYLTGSTVVVLPDGNSEAEARKVPLGSLWKLFVYAYLAETNAKEPAYVCSSKNPESISEERYCCDPGGSIGRNAALSRSCAPYFSPARLGIRGNRWRTHWQSRIRQSWVLDLKNLQPQTEVPLAELLEAISRISPQARAEARVAMLDTGIAGYGRDAWTRLGTGIRYKTYSWHLADSSAFGGAAGWLADGTPFWFGASGSSRTALTNWAAQIATALPEPRWHLAETNLDNNSCVDVDFFARYKLSAVWHQHEPVRARPGDLNGSYRLQFANGNWLSINARGDLSLENGKEAPEITGRFGINNYVARVIDREGSAGSVQAARALAIAARSYLVQNADFAGGCWRIKDSSRTQRVSPDPPSGGALAAAWFTDDIILKGVPVNYHQTAAGNNRMAWSDAIAKAADGRDFERILSDSYPHATISTLSGRTECRQLVSAEAWLSRAVVDWLPRLNREAGFEAPDTTPMICALGEGNPYSDQQRMRIYVRGWRSLDERVTLAHEYLHLAFRYYPSGGNEDYIERLARRLIED